MIRDRLVVGICDNALSKRLQLDAALTLDKAKKTVKKTVRQQEAVGTTAQRNSEGLRPASTTKRIL